VDADDIELLVGTARRVLAPGNPTALVDELADAGIAATAEVTAALLRTQGEELARSTLLDLVLAGADHRRDLRVVLPVPGRSTPPARRVGARLDVDGIVLVPEGAGTLLTHSGGEAYVVPAGMLRIEAAAGFDPALGMAAVRGEFPADLPLAGRHWEQVAEIAGRALAHELVGVGERARRVAMAHVEQRRQFGRPIGALQTVRHRLVDVHVELQAARAVLAAVDRADRPDEIDLRAAKASAGRAALTAVALAQQVCGAMGFTAEFGLHAIVRRAYLLDSLLGGADDIEFELGGLLAARGTAVAVPVL